MDANPANLALKLVNVPVAMTPAGIGALMAVQNGPDRKSGFLRASRGDVEAYSPGVSAEDRQRPTNGPYEIVVGVAVVRIEGVLIQKSGALGPHLGITGYDSIRASISLALADHRVRAVVLDIDSAGGEVAGMLDLADAIYAARRCKPILAICSEVAYSAAYCLASACEQVTVPRTGGTGSVGAVLAHTDYSRALEMGGLKVTLIASGAHKTDGVDCLPLSKEAHSRLQREVDAVGEMFVQTVARNRGLSAAKVRGTQAAMYLGQQGVDAGFADAVMSPDEAFATLLRQLDATRPPNRIHQGRHGARTAPQEASRVPSLRTAKRSWSQIAFVRELREALR